MSLEPNTIYLLITIVGIAKSLLEIFRTVIIVTMYLYVFPLLNFYAKPLSITQKMSCWFSNLFSGICPKLYPLNWDGGLYVGFTVLGLIIDSLALLSERLYEISSFAG
jgi:hypothetical protein